MRELPVERSDMPEESNSPCHNGDSNHSVIDAERQGRESAANQLGGIPARQADNAHAPIKYVEALEKLGRTSEAEAALARAIQATPNDLNLLERYAVIAQESHRWSEALARWEALISLHPKHFWSYFGAHRACIAMGQYGCAEKLLQRSMDLFPERPEPLEWLVKLFLEQRRFDKAEIAAQQLIQKHSHYLWGHFGLNLALQAQHRFNAAEAVLLRAIELFPTQPEPLDWLGNAFFQSHRWDDSLLYWHRHIIQHPKLPAGYLGAAKALTMLRRVGEAEATLRQGLIVIPSNAELSSSLSMAQLEAQRWNACIAKWRKMAESNSVEQAASVLDLLIMEGQLDVAEAGCWTQYWSMPDNQKFRDLMTRSWARGTLLPRQIYFIRKNAHMFLNDVHSQLEYGRFLIRNRQFEDAEPIFHNILAQSPQNPEAISALMRIHSDRGETKRQIEWINSLVKSDKLDGYTRATLLQRRHHLIRHDRGSRDIDLREELVRQNVPLTPIQSQALSLQNDILTANERRRQHVINWERPRIALCVSGQLRGYQLAFESWKERLEAVAEVDTFIHTWENVGSSGGAHGHIGRLLPSAISKHLPLALVQIEAFETAFPSAYATLANSMVVNVSEIEDFYSSKHAEVEVDSDFEVTHELGDGLRHNGNFNQCKMFYKIWACNLLKSRFEENGGFIYDLVIRVRPDLMLGEFHLDEIRDLIGDGRSVATSYALSGGFGDQFAVGSSYAINIYSEVWPHMVAAGTTSYLPGTPPEFAESLLLNHLYCYGLELRHLRMSFANRLVNPTPNLRAFLAAILIDVRGQAPSRTAYDIVHEVMRLLIDDALPSVGPTGALVLLNEIESSMSTERAFGRPWRALARIHQFSGEGSRANEALERDRAQSLSFSEGS